MKNSDYKSYRLRVSGAKGGHSGVDIHKNLANTNIVLTRILCILQRYYELCLVAVDGGTMHNAIPRESTADILVKNDITGNY